MSTFISLFEQMLYKPSSTQVGNLSPFSESHAESLRPPQAGFNGKSKGNVACNEKHIHHLIRDHVDNNPFHPAIEFSQDYMTYMQLEDYSNSLAERLVRQGIRSNQAIGIALDRSPWAVVAMLGVWKAGSHIVPFCPNTDNRAISELLHRAKISTVVVSPSYASSLSKLSDCRCVVVAADTLPAPNTAFLKPAYRSPVTPTSSDYAFGFLPLSEDPVSGLSFTTHGELCAELSKLGNQMTMDTDTRSLMYNELWSTTMLVDILAPLAHGGTLCFPELDGSIASLTKSIETCRVNVATIPVAVSRALNPHDLPTLRHLCLYGGIPTRQDTAQWSRFVGLYLAWGVADMGTIAFVGSPSQDHHGEFVSSAVGTHISVVNPHNISARIPRGAIGTLKPVHSYRSESGDREPRTAKLQQFRANVDGSLSLIESTTEQKQTINGHRFEVRHIEKAIRDHLPIFADVVVDLYAPQALGDEPRLGAIVIASSSRSWISGEGATTLRSKLQALLPPTSIPTFFTSTPTFPLTTAGELDRSRLQKLVRNAAIESLAIFPEANDDSDAALSSTERLLASLWTKTLHLDENIQLSRNDDFFENLNGNSLLALRLAVELKRHHWLLRVSTMFEQSTLEAMAAAMEPDSSS